MYGICQKKERIPNKSFLLEWLGYVKELILKDSKDGHKINIQECLRFHRWKTYPSFTIVSSLFDFQTLRKDFLSFQS